MRGSATIPVVFMVAVTACGPAGDGGGFDVVLDTLFTVGELEGEGPEILGWIADVAATDDGFYVLDMQAPALRLFDLEGNHLASVEAEGQGPGELDAPHDLAVDPDLDVLVATGVSHPLVRGFSLARGAETWRTEIPAFRMVEFAIHPSGGITAASFPEDGIQLARSLVRWSDDVALLQHEARSRGGPAGDEFALGVESRFIDLATGTILARSDSLPLLMAVHGDRAYGVRHTPYPQVVVYGR